MSTKKIETILLRIERLLVKALRTREPKRRARPIGARIAESIAP